MQQLLMRPLPIAHLSGFWEGANAVGVIFHKIGQGKYRCADKAKPRHPFGKMTKASLNVNRLKYVEKIQTENVNRLKYVEKIQTENVNRLKYVEKIRTENVNKWKNLNKSR